MSAKSGFGTNARRLEDNAQHWLVGGGEMGKLIRSMDWSKTPLGPIESWPQSLRTTVSLCLASNFPIALAWGPKHVQIYNDGYWPICGEKHPGSMGQDFTECWAAPWPVIGEAFARALAGQTSFLENQRMFLDRNGYLEETFFTFSFSPIRDAGADDYLAKPFSAQELLARVRTHLELARVRREWANELEQANNELEAFSYSVSHDLRAPLRVIDGFSTLLVEEYADGLDEQARNYIRRIRTGIQKMSGLIDDLLNLSRVTRAALQKEMINLTELAHGVVTDLRNRDPAREVVVDIFDGLCAHGDGPLMTIVLTNLLGNAWKYSAKQSAAHIVFGHATKEKETIFYIRDNGAGFDMAHAGKLFAPFQRLHRDSEFEGTGIGLATVQRIISRHGGRIWAEAVPGAGATFFFTLGGTKQ
jgi:signal transduction histidine kinase